MRRAFPRAAAAVLSLLVMVWARPGVATIEPSSSRGFSPDQAYHVNGIDSVNDFTGNLDVNIPIGPTFKTNGTLTYSFSLHYHSNLWDYEEYDGENGHPLGGVPSNWDKRPPIDAFPILDFNAGLGWRMSVGGHPKRHPLGFFQTTFVTDSGAEHTEYGQLVTGQPATPTPGLLFTNDASYIRVTTSGTTQTAEYPDGIRERFVCVAACGSLAASWELDQRSDPFGDILYVSRSAEPESDGGTWVWTYHEAIGAGPYPDHNTASLTEVRVHTVVLTRDSRMTGGYRVTQITLASSGPGNQAVYTFGYSNADIIRPYTHNFVSSPTVPFGTVAGHRMPLVLLTSITTPPNADNTSSGDWAFSYIVDPDPSDYPGDVQTATTPDGQTTWQISHYSGLLETVTLPTKGQYRYKYDQRVLPKQYCFGGPEVMDQDFVSIAVRERAILKPDGSLDGDRPWRYFGRGFGIGGYQGPEREFITGALDPFGALDVSYFSTFTGDGCNFNPQNVYNKFEWGVNQSKEEVDSSGRFLQSRVFQCTNTTPFDSDSDTAYDALRRLLPRYLYSPSDTLSCGQPLRTTYSTWENDGGYCRGELLTDCDQRNRRIQSTATVYHDDGDTFTEVIHDDYDGLGHYRTMKTGGNFWSNNLSNITGGDERISFTNFNPGVVFLNDAFAAFPNGGSLQTLTWILDTYDLKKVKQARNGQPGGPNPQVSSTLFLFDATTGFLERERRLRNSVDCAWNASVARAACYDSGSLDSHDIVTEHDRTQNGTATSILTSYFGGDNASISTSGDLTTPIGDSADYVLRRDYRYGEVEASGYYDCGATNPVLMVEQNTIDPHTGLVVSSRDSAGAETDYAYDNLGRYTSINPPGNDAPVSFTYAAATVSQPATIASKTIDASGAVLRTTSYDIDHLGRVVAERNQVPGLGGNLIASSKFTGYLATGWKSFETTIGPDQATGYTTYKDFDAFGRPQTVVNPDNGGGKTSKTTYIYNGIRTIVETVHGLALGPAGNGAAQTSRSYDRFGNLSKISESSGAGGSDTRTRYEYDNLDNLVLVDGANGQQRFFNYDMRGFLFAETVPELAGGTLRHLGYDSRGNAHQQSYTGPNSPATPFDLSVDYDAAERIIGVTQSSTGNLLKGFTFYPQNGSGIPALSAGKLRRSIRNNWTPAVTAPNGALTNTPVTLEYAYDAGTGRVASRTTTLSGLSFTTRFTYDPLGNMSSVAYPQMTGQCAGCPAFGPTRTVTNTYKEGRLIAVPSFASSITYSANGTAATVAHSNGATDYFDADPNYMQRPAAIRTTFPGSAAWVTGTYRYDAAGNVSAIGPSQSYVYDKVGRLVQATLSNGTQSFAYDPNGNLTNLPGTSASSNSVPLDGATNRLATTNAAYDVAGNLTNWVDPRDNSVALRDYDPFDRITHNRGAGQGKIYIYDPGDERAAVFDYGSSPTSVRETWSIRGLGNEVLRDFTRTRSTTAGDAGTWTWRDNVYRGTSLLAQIRPLGGGEDVQHLHLDHLGSVRRTSNSAGAMIDDQEFYPFGQEVNERPDENRFKFTGQERDVSSNPIGHVDYMHARYYGPMTGRFLSIDPDGKDVEQPQSWNRYSYTLNNPITKTDPDGRCVEDLCIGEGIAAYALVTAVAAWAVAPSPVDSSKSNIAMVGQQLQQGAKAVVDLVKEMRSPQGKPGEVRGPDEKPGDFKLPDRVDLWEEAGGRCVICGVPTAKPGTKPVPGQTLPANTDHIIPKADNGSNRKPNGQNTCETCNKSGGRRGAPKTTGAEKLQPPTADTSPKPPPPPPPPVRPDAQ